MRRYNRQELSLMSSEDIVKAFGKNLTSKLNTLLTIAGNSEDDSGIVKTLSKLSITAAKFGRSYVENNRNDMEVYVDCDTVGNVMQPIGNQRCFMRLYKEGYRKNTLKATTYRGTSLESVRRVATDIGQSLTSVLVKVMIALCIENRQRRIQKFDSWEALILFLKKVFKWNGKTNDFGVVFNRIIECIKIVRYEFRSVPKLEPKRRGNIEVKGQTINIDDLSKLDLVHELLAQLVLFSTMFELLLSLPLLPSFGNFLEKETGSLDWLEESLIEMSEQLDKIDSWAEALLRKYTEESSEVYKFSLKMDRVTASIWDDLRYLL